MRSSSKREIAAVFFENLISSQQVFSKRLLITTRSKSKSSKFQLLKNHDVLLFLNHCRGLISKKFQKVMGIISQQVPDFKAFKRPTPYKCSSSSKFFISKQSVTIQCITTSAPKIAIILSKDPLFTLSQRILPPLILRPYFH